jgi:Tfp pilus assembly protein PilF
MAYTFLKKDEEGIAEYRKTLELKPGLYEAELNEGILLLRQKNPADALTLLDDAAKQKPAEFAAQFNLAEAQLQTGSTEQAAESYRQAAGIDPKSAAAELGWGRALALDGKLDEAAPHFRAAIARDARFHDALLSLAELYEEHKQFDAALAIYREFPNNADVQQHAGHLLLESQKFGDAVRDFEQAYQSAPTGANRKNLAAAYLQAQQTDKALPLLEKAVAEEPANYDLRLGYAHALRDAKNYQAAATQFREAARLKPTETKTWNELGSMLYLAGDRDGALAALAQARQLGDDTPGNWFLTAIMLDAAHESKRSLAKDQNAAEGVGQAMTRFVLAVLLLSGSWARADLKRAMAEPNLEKRSSLALENAAAALKSARAAYDKGDNDQVVKDAAEVLESVNLAATSLEESGKNPRRSAWFKKAEISTRDLSRRIQDFQDQMSYVDRPLLDPLKTRVQEVHEQLLMGVMEGKKK